MKKLLQEMQSGSRESFMTAYTGVSDAKITSQHSRYVDEFLYRLIV